MSTRQEHIIRFKNRRIHLSFIPRTGQCTQCPNNLYDGSCKTTDMHHILGYFIIFPWFGTIELCDPCHNKVTAVQRWGYDYQAAMEKQILDAIKNAPNGLWTHEIAPIINRSRYTVNTFTRRLLQQGKLKRIGKAFHIT